MGYNSLKSRINNFLLVIILFGGISNFATAQKLVRSEVDKFTKEEVKETSIEDLCQKNVMGKGCHIIQVGILKKNENVQLYGNLGTTDTQKYEKGNGLMLLFEDESVLELETNFTGLSGPFKAVGFMRAGTHMFSTSFSLSDDEIKQLKSKKIVSARISYLGGHQDFEIKNKKQSLIIRMLKLVGIE